MFGSGAYGQPPFAASAVTTPAVTIAPFALQEQSDPDVLTFLVGNLPTIVATLTESGADGVGSWSLNAIGGVEHVIQESGSDSFGGASLNVDIEVNFGLTESGPDPFNGAITSVATVVMGMQEQPTQDTMTMVNTATVELVPVLVEIGSDTYRQQLVNQIMVDVFALQESGSDSASMSFKAQVDVDMDVSEEADSDTFSAAATVTANFDAGLVETDIDSFEIDVGMPAVMTSDLVESGSDTAAFEIDAISTISPVLAETGSDILDIEIEAHRGKLEVILVETGIDTFSASLTVTMTAAHNIQETELDQLTSVAGSVASFSWAVQEENIGAHTQDTLAMDFGAQSTANMDIDSDVDLDSVSVQIQNVADFTVSLTEQATPDTIEIDVKGQATINQAIVESPTQDTAAFALGSIAGVYSNLRETGTPRDGVTIAVSTRTEVEGAIQEGLGPDTLSQPVKALVDVSMDIMEPQLDSVVVDVSVPRQIAAFELSESERADTFFMRLFQDRDPSDIPARLTGCPPPPKDVTGNPYQETLIGQPVINSTLTGSPWIQIIIGNPPANGDESMASIQNITGFHKGEQIEIILDAKNPDGSTLTSPATNTVTCIISQTARGPALIEVDDTPEVVLTDAGNSQWTIQIPASAQSELVGGQEYHYAIWSKDGSADPLLQVKGTIALQESVLPS